jgi:hypothetical protein
VRAEGTRSRRDRGHGGRLAGEGRRLAYRGDLKSGGKMRCGRHDDDD